MGLMLCAGCSSNVPDGVAVCPKCSYEPISQADVAYNSRVTLWNRVLVLVCSIIWVGAIRSTGRHPGISNYLQTMVILNVCAFPLWLAFKHLASRPRRNWWGTALIPAK